MAVIITTEASYDALLAHVTAEITHLRATMAERDAEIAALKAEREWRPIADMTYEIREDGEPVLLYKPDEPRSGPEHVVAYWGEWPGKGYCWVRCGGRPIEWISYWTDTPTPHGIVTHWQPLPPAPEAT